MADDLDLEAEDIEFGMALEEVGYDEEYRPRLKNMGKIQRTKITGFDQRLPMVIYGLRDDTIHGTDSEGTPCSLITFRWYLRQRQPSKRIKSAQISIIFATTRKDQKTRDPWYDPHVRAVAPDGTYSLLQTTQTINKKKSVEGNIAGGFGGSSVGVKTIYELSRSLETSDQIVINGSPYNDNTGEEQGDPDRSNAVEWNLFENEAQKSGLPTFFRTAVLLKRRDGDDEQFSAAFTIHAKVDVITDTQTTLKRMFGLVPHDEPIIFDPTSKGKTRFTEFSTKLDMVGLEDECMFVMFNSVPGQDDGAKAEGITAAPEEKDER